MNARSIFLGGLLAVTACGDLHPVNGNLTQAQPLEPAQTVSIIFTPAPDDTPLHGTAEGSDFAIKSVVFAQGLNADQHQELQVAVADIPNYCDVLSSGARADGFVARLRLVNMGSAGQALAVDANTYNESAPPTWTGYVSDIPPPGAQAGASASAPLAPGRYMTGGFTRLQMGCSTQQLNPAFVGSNVTLDALDATQARGAAVLWFSDGVGTTTGFSLSGTFTATPCGALATDIAKTPFVAFAPPAHCANE